MDEPLAASERCGAAFSQDLDTCWYEVAFLRSKLDHQEIFKIHRECHDARRESIETAQTYRPLCNLPEGLSEETRQVFTRLRYVLKLAGRKVDWYYAPHSP
jgi:hypothetical protein